MSYNGSGVFNINTAGQPVVTGTVISSTAFNALTADLATGLTTALTKDGQTTPTANIPMGGFKITGIAAATTLGDALSYGRAATVSTLTNSALTSGRVPYATTAGLLTDSANLTFDGTNLILGSANPLFQGSSSTGSAAMSNNSAGAYIRVYGSSHATRPNYTDFINGSSTSTFDGSGNLGLGVTPSAWDSAYLAMQFPYGGSLSGYKGSSAPILNLSTNAYYNSGNKYVISAAATQYSQNQGVHSWYNAASGTAGNAITFTQAMTLDASGNLGIGTTSPTSKLQVGTGAAASTVQAQFLGGVTVFENAGATASVPTITFNNDLDTGINNPSGNTIALYTGGSERARIDSSGNLFVACTTFPSASVYGLAYITSGGTNGYLFNSVSSTGTASHFIFGNANGTVGSISTNGSLTSYNVTSDYRLKENIAPMTGALAKVAQLKPVTYKWKVNGSDGQGFIAHELQAVVPDCVTGEKDAVDADGKPIYQGMDTSHLVATLVSAIQELNARLIALESK
jgi:hypothetical protein